MGKRLRVPFNPIIDSSMYIEDRYTANYSLFNEDELSFIWGNCKTMTTQVFIKSFQDKFEDMNRSYNTLLKAKKNAKDGVDPNKRLENSLWKNR